MHGPVTVLTGGVGGAKLVSGLVGILPAGDVTAIINVGDDFTHLGLPVSPDIDTLLYTLAGKADPDRGWGRTGESWNFMAALRELGGEDWFQLGDGDLALHVLRGAARAAGANLSAITAHFARQWKIAATLLPATDDPVATYLDTDEGELDFQHYFVARRCAPAVSRIRFVGAQRAQPAPGVLAAIARKDNQAVLIAPSNPYLSIDPILAVPGMRDALASAPAPVVAISPLVGGKAVKGPTGKLMRELGVPLHAGAIARHYAGIIDAILIDASDPEELDLAIPAARTNTLMLTHEDRARVAAAALALARSVS